MIASRNITILFLILLVACNRSIKKTSPIESSVKRNYYYAREDSFTRMLNSPELIALNDSMKWNFYCIYGSDSTSWGVYEKQYPKTPLAFLKLRLSYLSQSSDTIYLLYNFFYNDSIEVDRYNGGKPIANGVAVNLSKGKVLGYEFDFLYTMSSSDGRFEHPLRPKVIAFIKENKDKLDPWFMEEAKKRGIFDSDVSK